MRNSISNESGRTLLVVISLVILCIGCISGKTENSIKYPKKLFLKNGSTIKFWEKNTENIKFEPYVGYTVDLDGSNFARLLLVSRDVESTWSEYANENMIVSYLWFTKKCEDCNLDRIKAIMADNGYSFKDKIALTITDPVTDKKLKIAVDRYELLGHKCILVTQPKGLNLLIGLSRSSSYNDLEKTYQASPYEVLQ